MMSCCVLRINYRALVWLSGLASGCFLVFALVSEYGFGLFPCELCLAQRVPYAVMVGLGVVACVVKSPKIMWFFALLCAGLFFVDAGIAFYHAAVEMHWITGPSACTANTQEQTLEEMRAAIMGAALVSCDQPMVHVLGLSMAAWNGVAALGCGVLMIWGLRVACDKEKKV